MRIPWLIVELLHSGKVREVYADGGDLILVASDRVSVYDVVLPTPIPDKGKILTALSLWWFERLAGVVPNHVISATDVPPQFAGRAIRCRRLRMVPVECVARGYLAGFGLDPAQVGRGSKRHRLEPAERLRVQRPEAR
jgi:phosphoribosylaminoimidazole-succinocarboxamide synthase